MPRLRSRSVATISFAFLLTVASAVCADEWMALPRDQWLPVSGYMSPEEYRKTYRHNQRLLRDEVKAYSTDALRSAGVPETGIRLMSVAAGLAVDGDARLHLNRRRHLSLEFRDVVDDDRGVLLGFRLKW